MSAMAHAPVAGWRTATVALGVVLFCAAAPAVGRAQGPGVPASDPRRARYQEQHDVHQYTAALAGIRHDVSVGITVPRRFLNEPETKSFKLHAEVRDRIPDEVRREGDPCFEILKQAFDLIRQAAPINARSPRISNAELEEENRLGRAAKRLIADADRCLEKLNRFVPPFLAARDPRRQPPPPAGGDWGNEPLRGGTSESETPDDTGGTRPRRGRPPRDREARDRGPRDPTRGGETSQDSDCLPPVDPHVVDRVRRERNEALRTLAGGGYMTDLTLRTMAKLAAARLQHLTEPNEGIAARTMRGARSAFDAAPSAVVEAGHAVAEYMTNSNEANHRRLYGAVQTAVNRAEHELKRVTANPHVTIAGIADDVLVGRFVGGGVKLCKAFGPDRLNALTRRIDEARRANRAVSAIGDDARRFAGTEENLTKRDPNPRPVPRPAPPKGPPPLVGPPPLAQLPERPAIPPGCYQNQCWPNAQAVDHYLRTGEWIEPRPREYPLAEELSDLKSPRRLITGDLRKKHGGANALDPNLGPGGQQAHADGLPVRADSKKAIEDTLGNDAPGAPGQGLRSPRQAYVFIDGEQIVPREMAGGAKKIVPRADGVTEHQFEGGPVNYERRLPNGTPEFFIQDSHVFNAWTLADGRVVFFDRATLTDPILKGNVDPNLWKTAKNVWLFRSR